MTDCTNDDLRDLLPDVVSGALSAADAARVSEHVATCVSCGEELALLRVARAVRPTAVAIDVARIVSALPSRGAPRLSVSDGGRAATATSARPDVATRRSVWRSSVWRMAAAVTIAAMGGWGVVASRGGVPATQAPVAAVFDTQPVVASLPNGARTAAGPTDSSPNVRDGSPARIASRVTEKSAVSLGDLSEYSDAELQGMLDRLEKWDGATAADPVPAVPIVPVSQKELSR